MISWQECIRNGSRNKADLIPDKPSKMPRPSKTLVGQGVPRMKLIEPSKPWSRGEVPSNHKPPKAPPIRKVNEDITPKRKPPKRKPPKVDDNMQRVEDKIDALSERMDKQFMMLAGMLDKFMAVHEEDKAAAALVEQAKQSATEEVARLRAELDSSIIMDDEGVSSLDYELFEISLVALEDDDTITPRLGETMVDLPEADLSPREIRKRERLERKKYIQNRTGGFGPL